MIQNGFFFPAPEMKPDSISRDGLINIESGCPERLKTKHKHMITGENFILLVPANLLFSFGNRDKVYQN
jgi:hypothetical protein